jgi:hypothetical protein
VLLNTDRNAATGPLLGADFAVVLDANGYGLLAWNGSDYVESTASAGQRCLDLHAGRTTASASVASADRLARQGDDEGRGARR